MKNNTTDTHSGNKRRNVFLHYTSATLVVMLIVSIFHAPTSAAYAAALEVYGPKVMTPESIEPSTPREEILKAALDNTESQLAKANSQVKATSAAFDAQVKKFETVDAIITKLHGFVGHSPYVLSGVGPTGWDCSGLVLWFYHEYKGIYLEHRASIQAEGGTKVDAPIPGDIVAFTYKGSKESYHVGIYVGGGYMIHAKNPNEDTVLESVEQFAAKNSKVAYIRY